MVLQIAYFILLCLCKRRSGFDLLKYQFAPTFDLLFIFRKSLALAIAYTQLNGWHFFIQPYSLILNSFSLWDNLTIKYSSLLSSTGSLSLRIEATN